VRLRGRKACGRRDSHTQLRHVRFRQPVQGVFDKAVRITLASMSAFENEVREPFSVALSVPI
jgi:hypothetical protein